MQKRSRRRSIASEFILAAERVQEVLYDLRDASREGAAQIC